MAELGNIAAHPKYKATKVSAALYFGIDPNLDESARALYDFLLKVSIDYRGMRYCAWPVMEDAINTVYMTEFAKDMTLQTVRSAFTTLRKNRYIRHVFHLELNKRIMELREFIGEKAK